ncbi:SDR family oxidoreductase [Cupriavidus basilensis]
MASHRPASAKGAELAFTYVGERFKDRINDFAEELWQQFWCSNAMLGSDEQIAATFAALGQSWDKLDGLVHSIGLRTARSDRRRLPSRASRANPSAWRTTFPPTASPALAKAALPMLSDKAACRCR